MIPRNSMIFGKAYVYGKNVLVLFKGISIPTKAISLDSKRLDDVTFEYTLARIELASVEQSAWLEKCIELDSYIPYEEFYIPNKNESKELEPIYKKLLNS